MKNIFVILNIFFFIQFGFSNNPITESEKPSIFDFLSYQEVLEVNLEMDVNEVVSNRKSDVSHPAKFSFKDEAGNSQEWNIKVNLRGKFRKAKCTEMPPLRLNFKKGDLKEKGLAKFDDLKLVTHCIEDEKEARDLLLKEYLIYKLFNQISKESFRVQLLRINYIDIKSKLKKQQWAFLIEDTAEMRSRINVEKVPNAFSLPESSFHSKVTKRMALFQYMIGNHDYEIRASRNLKIVKKENQYIPIPYDFDFSFMVNAPYTVIEPHLQITSIYDRVYLGFENDLKAMEGTKAFFFAKKKVLYKTVRRFKLLDGKSRKDVLYYLDTFFDNLDEIQPMSKPMMLEKPLID